MQSVALHSRRPPATPFDSFFHRRTPRWYNRGALLVAFGGATLSGCAFLFLALTLIA